MFVNMNILIVPYVLHLFCFTSGILHTCNLRICRQLSLVHTVGISEWLHWSDQRVRKEEYMATQDSKRTEDSKLLHIKHTIVTILYNSVQFYHPRIKIPCLLLHLYYDGVFLLPSHLPVLRFQSGSGPTSILFAFKNIPLCRCDPVKSPSFLWVFGIDWRNTYGIAYILPMVRTQNPATTNPRPPKRVIYNHSRRKQQKPQSLGGLIFGRCWQRLNELSGGLSLATTLVSTSFCRQTQHAQEWVTGSNKRPRRNPDPMNSSRWMHRSNHMQINIWMMRIWFWRTFLSIPSSAIPQRGWTLSQD